jgi:hypothetical protein
MFYTLNRKENETKNEEHLMLGINPKSETEWVPSNAMQLLALFSLIYL